METQARSVAVERTVYAQAGLDLAGDFELGCEGLKWGGIKLAEPEMSTGGGQAARQSMMLSTSDGKRRMMMGWVNVAEGTARLRDHLSVDEAWQTRFGESLFLDDAGYTRALQLAEFLLFKHDIEVRREVRVFREPEPAPVVEIDPRQQQLTILSVAFLGAAAAVTAALLIL